jgi:hypothetical protein
MVLGATEALGFAAAMPALQSLLTQGSEPSEVGRIQGMFGTTQTALTAVSAALAGAAFAVASWLPFVTAAVLTTTALVVTAIVWRTVPGHVHAELHSVDVASAPSPTAVPAPVAVGDTAPPPTDVAQAAVGVSSEVQ